VNLKKIFPTIIILMMIGAAIVDIIKKDFKGTVYWSAAALVNIAVTWL
jgi:Na+/H+ antiporter NhaC